MNVGNLAPFSAMVVLIAVTCSVRHRLRYCCGLPVEINNDQDQRRSTVGALNEGSAEGKAGLEIRRDPQIHSCQDSRQP